jgi:putative phosphoribosyl transferase
LWTNGSIIELMFKDREEAAQLLAVKILKTVKDENFVVLSLARGAIGMGKIIASYFSSPFDIIVCKKISAPLNEELAIGAVASGNIVYWNEDILSTLPLKKIQIKRLRQQKEEERKELEKKIRFRKRRVNVKNKTVILIDDGVATGATVSAGLLYLKKEKAKKVILATPVIAKDTFLNLKKIFDKIITLEKSGDFLAVGQFYQNFRQVTDKEVIDLIR